MKKILAILACTIITLSAVSFAAAGDLPDFIQLSNNVEGVYFVDADPATEHSMSTAHTQGNRVFFSSSNDSLIYYNEYDDEVPTDNQLEGHISNFASDSTDYTGTL